MTKLKTLYQNVFSALEKILNEYLAAESQYGYVEQLDERTRAARIAHYEKQLEKIEEYRPKVEFYRKLAEKHMESRNLLATEGMEDIIGQPRELNFKHMHDWATYIDPTNSDDPYAQRIYVMAKCNEKYLDHKKKHFEEELAALNENKPDSEMGSEELRKALLNAERKTDAYLNGEEWNSFVTAFRNVNDQQHNMLTSLEVLNKTDISAVERLGLQEKYLPVLDSKRSAVKSQLGAAYDDAGSKVMLPLELEDDTEHVFIISNNIGKEKKVYRGIQNYLLQRIGNSVPGSLHINMLDATHFNSTLLGQLRALEEKGIIADIPKDDEEITDSLKVIISDFFEVDEKLGVVDSVKEFNQSHDINSQIARRIVIAVGYPSAYNGEALNLLNRIILNHEHYGVTVILSDTQYHERKNDNNRDITSHLITGVLRFYFDENKETLSFEGAEPAAFSFYELSQPVPEHFSETYAEQLKKDGTKGNEYIQRVAYDLSYPANYHRHNKQLVLEYGVNSSDIVRSIPFDEENYATFLMGASGSGKSTLLHTLITGIIRKYHPDDVELWLADFKMAEFSQYINPMPPHVKYILLDESAELVYDLIDKLTAEMMKRQRYFMQNPKIKNISQVPEEEYMPVIFLILDEFSIMSQAVAESEEYKLKLQNLLAKGRALGFKFLFASQSFMNGISGLTRTAKEQVQSRIAMKNSQEEINETLELTASDKTDRVRTWMEALPPHYALYKYRENDRMAIERVKVLYFPGKDDEAYLPQRNLINSINENMVRSDTYRLEDVKYYTDKKPVVVDGNSYTAFEKRQIRSALRTYRNEHKNEYTSNDSFFVLGVPRLMENLKISAFTEETRENMLFLTKTQELAQTASVLMSIALCFQLQHKHVELWVYGRNRLFREYKDSLWQKFDIFEGEKAVENRIEQLKNEMQSPTGIPNEHLIILLGMERLIESFDASETSAGRSLYKTNQAAVVKTEEGNALQIKTQQWGKKRKELVSQFQKEGKSQEEIKRLISKEEDIFFADTDLSIVGVDESTENKPAFVPTESVDYRKDFGLLVQQGSRQGFHFVCVVNSFVDFKQIGIKTEYFRHKLSYNLSRDDAMNVFGTFKSAVSLPDHVLYYSNGEESWSLRPYLHEGLTWDGWYVDEKSGKASNAFDDSIEAKESS